MNTDVDLELELEDEGEDSGKPDADFVAAREELQTRAVAAGMAVSEIAIPDEPIALRLAMKCGPRERPIFLSTAESIRRVLAVPFELYTFLCGFEALASYPGRTIEAAIRPVGVGFVPATLVYRRLFIDGGSGFDGDLGTVCVTLESPSPMLPRIEISAPTETFKTLTRTRPLRSQLTLKLTGCSIRTHDEAVNLLRRTADALFFQIDLLKGVPVYLERERHRKLRRASGRDTVALSTELQYPRTEYDESPMSLYWYARSAAGMPLLQFLAFYQVVEFYFPVHAEAEAQRKLKAVLKDPTFRSDRDADIGRLLTAIQSSRNGSFGSEKQQLKATIDECVDVDKLRDFLVADPDRIAFYTGKTKHGSKKKIPLATPEVDLRPDTAARLYDIRCGIVHTKNDASEEVPLLLPFSNEAEQLVHDIALMEYVARSVLMACSAPFQAGG